MGLASTIAESLVEAPYMVQPLWYIRRKTTVRGPYPVPQLEEALRNGEIAPSDEISLDGEQWQPLGDGRALRLKVQREVRTGEATDDAWRSERERARQRWEDGAAIEPVDPGDSVFDAVRLQSLQADHVETRALLDAQAKRAPSLLIVVAAVGLLALIGLFVWYGQSTTPLRTDLGKGGQCAAPATPGSSWAGCDKRGIVMKGADLHSMTLTAVRLDGAQLAGSNLSYANLGRANLRGADLTNVLLVGANLDGADLTGADLTGADLSYATLNKANIEGVRLDGVRLGKTTWVGGALCERQSECR